MELKLFDVALGTKILSRRYRGSLKDCRTMIDSFTNDVSAAIAENDDPKGQWDFTMGSIF